MQPRSIHTATGFVVSVALLLGLGGGCGDEAKAPSTPAARQALDAALAAWSRGEKPGDLAAAQPPVFVHDTPWGQGQKLSSYEIVGEDESKGAVVEKQFNVRLSLAKPDRTEEVRYHVLGTNPLMVFRDEDYQRNINMENGPSISKTPQRGRAPR